MGDVEVEVEVQIVEVEAVGAEEMMITRTKIIRMIIILNIRTMMEKTMGMGRTIVMAKNMGMITAMTIMERTVTMGKHTVMMGKMGTL